MIDISVNQIIKEGLVNLVGQTRESKTLEFKCDMPARASEEEGKFLAVALALANTSGGDLLSGIEAEDELVSGVPGVKLSASADIGTAMRPVFNHMWNASGQTSSEIFDAEDNWRGRT